MTGTSSAPPRTVLVGGSLFDGRSHARVERVTVVIAGGRIEQVSTAPAQSVLRPTDDVIDVNGKTILPGLIDCHVHHIYHFYRNLQEIANTSIEAATLVGVQNARILLEAGYTTVRDMGTRGNIAVALRDAVAEGLIPGPKIVASGRIVTSTAGLADSMPSWTRNDATFAAIADGPDAVRRVVRQQIKDGVDNIKLEGSGAEASPYAATWMATSSYEEMAAAVDEAHRRGITVGVHAQSYEGARNAVRAGADTLEHGTRLDDETLDLLARGPTVLVPTLCTLHSVLELGEKMGVPAKMTSEMRVNEPLWLESLARARAAGVTIAAGGDVGNRYPQGSNARELELLVQAGFSPAEALQAATRNAAQALHREDRVGTVEVGKQADLLVVEGDPLVDIRVLQDPARLWLVMQDGRPVAGTHCRPEKESSVAAATDNGR